MHELAVTENILEISLRHANKAHAQQINKVYLVIGQLSSIIDDSVQFYWEILTDNTIAKGSQLIFRRVPTKLECINCQNIFHPEETSMTCPKCGGFQVNILEGKEFFVEAIDVESP